MTKRARNSMEMKFSASLEPCEKCGSCDTSGLSLFGSGTGWALSGECPTCGTPRGFSFVSMGSPHVRTSVFDLGDGPSELISTSEFQAALARASRLVIDQPSTLEPRAWHEALKALTRTLICLNELAKLGVDTASELATYQAVLDKYVADGKRVAALEHPPEPPKPPKPTPVGELSRESLERHLDWLHRNRSGAGRLELEHHDFSNRRDIGSPDLAYAKLVDVVLDGADLSWVTFEHASLFDNSAKRTVLDWASFKHAVIMGSSFVRAKLRFSSFDGAEIGESDLTQADLDRTSWKGAKLWDVVLVGARFGSSALDGGHFLRCDMRRAIFAATEPVLPNTTRAVFEDCDLSTTTWEGRDLRGARFVRCKLEGARGPAKLVEGIEVDDCDIDLCTFEQLVR